MTEADVIVGSIVLGWDGHVALSECLMAELVLHDVSLAVFLPQLLQVLLHVHLSGGLEDLGPRSWIGSLVLPLVEERSR